MTFEVRGPSPDGDYFIVEMDGEEERALDETYETQKAAALVAKRLNKPSE